MVRNGRAESRGPRCGWKGCERPAAIDVLVGDLLRRTRTRHGSYCVPHSIIRSRDLRAKTGKDVWFAIIRPETGHQP